MSDDTYLTVAEVRCLTCRKYAAHQKRTLTQMRWTFTVAADGRPLVLRSYHDQQQRRIVGTEVAQIS